MKKLTFEPETFQYKEPHRERMRVLRAAERVAATRKRARDRARELARVSGDDAERKALELAEAGYGVVHVMEQAGVDGSVARAIVLGDVR